MTFLTILAFASCKPKLVWSDEFNYTGIPDSVKWNYDLGANNGWGNNEQQAYTRLSKNVRVEDGHLIIEAHLDSIDGKAFSSSRIVSKHKGDWLYGRIEVSAKLPYGRGTWPAIWMLSTDWEYGGWPASGEIDIMEHVGYNQDSVFGTIHTASYNHIKHTEKSGKVLVHDAAEEFHVYAINWTKDKIDFFVDDQLYYTAARSENDTFKEWPFDKRFHLIMNIAVGGNWGGKMGIDESIWPQKMEIDYVRVYQ
ncbi:glycoside hydrolase family 16 protein [Chryseotalea sanaruensis]|uniref:Glycoside hydrolase family 16 protein n=2 Tax=Chryseotalea sanaruensis TaxID=2482724 RepID=A0A401U5V1_9BACT|nr:glycoside hydrolase family 16 protein [Chryseotalea sanaruensis]